MIFCEGKREKMTGQEICNLMDSLKKRGMSAEEIIEIIYEVEGRIPPEKKEEEE